MARSPRRQHDLADVPAVLHEAEGVDAIGDRPDAVRQRGQLPAGHAPDDVPQHRAEERRPLTDHAVEVDGEEREVLAERQQAQPGVLIDVPLADLEEPAVIGEAGDPPRDGLAGQGVEDHVHAPAAGAPEHLVGEVERPRVHDALDPERPEVLPLLGCTGGGEDLGPGAAGQLNSRQADAARRRMDQDALSRPEPAQVFQGVGRGEEGDREGRGLLETQPGRLERDQLGPRHDVAAEGEAGDRQHLVADVQVYRRPRRRP